MPNVHVGCNKICSGQSSSVMIDSYCLTDHDVTLSKVLPELFTSGYRLVQNQRNNLTFSFGRIYSKKCKGIPMERGFCFIEALIVANASDIYELSPINFVFAQKTQISEFCATKGKV